MTLKILAIGDPHSKVSNQEELRACADRCAEQIRAHAPKAVVLLGDLGNDHEKVYVAALNGMAYFIGRLVAAALDVGCKIYWLVGNHEYINNSQFLTEEHALNVFKAWPSVVVVDKPLRLKTAEGAVVMCPYVPPGRFQEAVVPYLTPEVIAVFCHQEFAGALLNGIPSKVGDEWPQPYPLAVSGHIHEYGRPQPNILYVGAPFAHTFADGDGQTISLLEFAAGSDMAETRLALGLPGKITVTMSIDEATGYVPPPNTKVRMNLTATTEEYNRFKKSEAYKTLSQAVKIIPQIVDKNTLKPNLERRTYVAMLRDECRAESQLVQEACEEVMDETHGADE